MCGIAGIFDTAGGRPAPETVRAMARTLAHRGPDNEGVHVSGPCALGHRRLSIIDLSEAGNQPMLSADGRYAMVYNGELYNFNELRTELEDLGCTFVSRSDSEVALQAFIQWGVDAFSRFNGMFALAIWDKLAEKLTLVRDRYGIKPLYVYWAGKTLLFGSEMKAMMAHPEFRRVPDYEGLYEYLTFQNFLSDRTLFKGVTLLPAATWMQVDMGGPASEKRYKWWDYSFGRDELQASEEECVEELDRLFSRAVRRQLVSDVDVGAYLSGGMDSGSITAIAARSIPYIKSFTCGFDLNSASGIELNYDERESAEYMSYLFRTEHYEMVLKSGDMERVIPRLVHHLEEPRVGQSYPNFYVAQLAGKFVKVVLSGTGGDELFAGYPWRYYRAAVNGGFDSYVDKYYGFWQRLLNRDEARSVLAPVWGEVRHLNPKELFREVLSGAGMTPRTPEDYINLSLYFEAKTFLHGLLVVEDKLSMAHSLETRVPFLDNDLVDFAMRVPVKYKLRDLGEVSRLNENDPGPKAHKYFQKTRDGKILLRKAMDRYIPEKITNMIKQGFSAPDASWFKGDSIDYVRRVIQNRDSCLYEFLDFDAVTSLADQHLRGEKNRRLLIWSFLSLANWCDGFLGDTECGNV